MKTIAALIAIAGIASVCAVANGQTYQFLNTPLAVPDAGPEVSISTAPIVGSGVISTVSLTMNWSPPHTYVGDLRLQLVFTPTGGGAPISADLSNRLGVGANLDGEYTFSDTGTVVFASPASIAGGLVQPGTYLAGTTAGVPVLLNTRFQNVPVSGIWTIKAQDFVGADFGSISSASITVVASAAPVPPSGTAAPLRIVRNPDIGGLGSGVLRVTTAGGANPASTVTGVRANLTSILGAGHASDQLFDNGTNGDLVAGDGIYSVRVTAPALLADGDYPVSFVVSDNRVPPRTGTGSTTATVVSVTPPATSTNLGTVAANAEVTGSASAGASEAAWFRFTSTTDAVSPGSFLDSYVAASSGYTDTFMAVYNSSGDFLVSDDDQGLGLLSQVSFGRTTPVRFYNGGGQADGFEGPLAAGTYYIAVVQYGTNTFGSPFLFTNNPFAPAETTIDLTVVTSNSAPAPIDPTATARFNPAAYNATTGNNPLGPVNIPAPTETLLSATVVAGLFPNSTGITVTADLLGAGLGASAAAVMHDDGLNGDVTAGDNIYSLIVPLAGLPVSTFTPTITVLDAEGRTASAAPTLTHREDVVITTTELGTLAFTGTPAALTGTTQIVGREVNWIKFTLAGAVDIGGTRFVDIDTNGSTMDTHLGLYDDAGNFLAVLDDDDGAGLQSALSFGSIDPTGRDTNPLGTANNGRDGGLAAGTYYIALNFWPATYGSPFVATTTSGGIGGEYIINVHSGDQNGGTGPTCIADINGDQIIDGSDFTLFINSFGVGDVSIDANADVAGGIPSGGDGIIDGSDFVAFINAFAAGC